MKQFVADRHTTPGTATLEPVNIPKVPVYETQADVTADLANLAVGQIVATKDTGTELSQPVDTVASGNLHAVTSNAVANLRKLVWTNPNPNDAMGAQTITFDESAQGYDFLEIEFTQYTDWRRHICKIPIGPKSQVQCLSIQQSQFYGNTRVIEGSTNTTIEIGGGVLNRLDGGLEADNNSCLIERIWAVK